MNIKQYVLKTLSNKEILDKLKDKKVYFLHAENADRNLYVEYEIINEYGSEYSEDKETITTYVVQVDIFSTKNYTELENIIKKHMKEAGFTRDTAVDLYEKDTKLYHKAMRFTIERNDF